MVLFLVVYEFRSHIFSLIVVGRDPNSTNLGLVYFKLMTGPGGLCSGQLYNVDQCRDRGICTGKESLTREIIRIQDSTAQHHCRISGLGVAWILGSLVGAFGVRYQSR
jgi:hypothetical protein